MSEDPTPSFSLRETFAGKSILIAGASGFLGKVWLTMMLEQFPEVGKIHVLLRRHRLRSARERFVQIINKSYVFANLHERHGAGLVDFVSSKVNVVEGDVAEEGLGLRPDVADMLRDELDLFVNSAGLVDFSPDPREARLTNVLGTLNCAEFVSRSKKCSFLHVSTCFVCGQREGLVEEKIVLDRTPNGAPFSVESEYDWLCKAAKDADQRQTALSGALNPLEEKRQLREEFIALGTERAKQLGWTNIYTYSKAMAEGLLKTRYEGKVRYAVLRPSIVESSLRYPFPGWNEGFNTCGPLAFLLGTWFRYMPARMENPFDVIPVDYVASSMMIASAQLLRGEASEVYQAASSSANPLTIDQAVDYTSESHCRYYARHGETWVQRWIRPHFRAKLIWDGFHPFSPKSMRRYCSVIRWILHGVGKLPPRFLFGWARAKGDLFARYEKKWRQIDGILLLFKPFIYDHLVVFQTENLARAAVQEKDFRFDLDWNWRSYWNDVHMPGLRRWCFGKIRREHVETFEPRHPFHWPTPEAADASPASRALPRARGA